MTISITGFAHNNVVVIPMAGDDAQLEPFALIPADNTVPSNFISANGVTHDRVTGLDWQQVDSNMNYSYINAIQHCRELTLDTKSVWRLPTSKELLSIVDFGTFSPAIDGSAFPGTDTLGYWTSTERVNSTSSRLTINFEVGEYSQSSTASGLNRVRCVRSNGQNALVNVFIDNSNGSISDLASGLIWEQQDSGDTYSQIDAINYCQNLVLAGSSNWRLPEIKELMSLVDYREPSPTANTTLFQFPPLTNGGFDYRSATNVAENNSSAWGFGFLIADHFSSINTFPSLVRCVR